MTNNLINGMRGRAGIWWRVNDHTGLQEAVPVLIESEFYEPGDPVPGYTLRHAVSGERFGGIDSRDVELGRRV